MADDPASAAGRRDRRLRQGRLPLRRHVASRLDPVPAGRHLGLAGDAPQEITAESLARVFAAKGVELFMLGTGKQPWLMPEALRWRFRDARIGLEVTPTGAGGAHLQHPVRRRPPRRRRADRGRLAAILASHGRFLSHCEELVRAADKDRYLATLFAPADKRGPLFALYAFNARDRRRARPRARADGGRDPPAMVARCA